MNDETDIDMEEAEMVQEVEHIPNETKNEAFLRLINKRLPLAVKRIRMVGNLTSQSYEFTEAQGAVVIEVLEKELQTIKDQFNRVMEVTDVPTIK